MPVSDYLVGLAFWAGSTGLVALAALAVLRRRLPGLTGPVRIAAGGLMVMAGVIAAHLLPGLLGGLSREAVVAVAAALALAGRCLPRVKGVPPSPAVEERWGDGRASTAIAGVAAGVVGLAYLTQAWAAAVVPADAIDPLTHHLPNVAAWVRSGDLWQVDQFVPLLANGNYPHNGDVLFLSAVLPWSNDAFVRPLNLAFVALLGVCVYALARELGSPRASAVLLTSVLGALPVTALATSYGAMTDIPMLAALAAGLLFLIRHFRTEQRGDLVLAGLGLGLAFGTKWYAVSSVGVLLAVWAGAWLLARRPPRALARHGASLAGLIAAAGGFWLLRNLVQSGNPVYPQEVAPLGIELFGAPFDPIRACAGFAIADYLGSPGILRDYALPAYRENYAGGGLILALGWLAAVVAAIGAWRRRDATGRAGVLAAGAVAVALLAGVYAVTPFTAFGLVDRPVLIGANARYLLPALMVAAVLGAAVVPRLDRLRVPFEALALLAALDGVRRAFSEPAGQVLVVGLGAVAAGLVAFGLLRARARSPRYWQGAATGAAALVALAAVALGHDRQREFNEGRYESIEATTDWISRNAPEGRRVALAGVWGVDTISPVLPAFGPRLGNHVEYLGPTVDGQLREYESRERWAGGVRRGRFDLVLVGRGGYGEGCPVPGSDTDDDAWARAEGFRPVASSAHLTLYRVPGVE